MKERALTAGILLVLGVAAVAWQTYGLPDVWCADEMTLVLSGMVERRSWNPHYFLYPSFMVDICYLVARLLGAESMAAHGHVCRSVSAAFYLGGVLCMGRTVELVLERRLPFAYFFSGTIGAFLHHAHIGTVNSCFFFTIVLALFQFVRTIVSRRERDFYLSVLACSLSVGAKYNGVFLFGVLPVVWLIAFGDIRSRRFVRALVLSLAIAPLPFLATTPYAVLDAPLFHEHVVLLAKLERPHFVRHVGLYGFLSFLLMNNLAFFSSVSFALVGAWGLTVHGVWLARWRALRSGRPRVFGASLVLAASFALYGVMTFTIGLWETRYFIPAALMIAISFLIALHSTDAPRLRIATIVLLVVFNSANAFANVVCFHLAAKARALSVLEPLEGRIGVISYPSRGPFQLGPLDARTDVFTVGLTDHDATTFDEYLLLIERFFAMRKPRWIVFEEIVTEWTVFRPRKDGQDFTKRHLYPNPGLAAWEAHLARAGYRPHAVIESCEGPLAMRWLIGGAYLWTAEGVGRRVHVYERRSPQ